MLGDYYNVQAANPNFAKDYTANKVKYATDPAAVKGFQKLAEVKAKGYVNSNYGSAHAGPGHEAARHRQGRAVPDADRSPSARLPDGPAAEDRLLRHPG